jgi:hypothetical protein
MQIDWGTASVAAGVPLIALIGGVYALSQRHDERIGNMKERTDERFGDHDQRIKENTEKIADLPKNYVPRTELDARLSTIEKNSEEIKRLLNWLIFYRRQPAGNVPPTPVPPEVPMGMPPEPDA